MPGDIQASRISQVNSQVRSEVIPRGTELSVLLGLAETDLDDLWESALGGLVTDALDRPSKGLRRQIVQAGFAIAHRLFAPAAHLNDYAPIIERCAEILELFHAGSLIVDDIEDNSQMRRGRLSLHNVYGVPLALNAGNWLYFLPFKLISEMSLTSSARAALTHECHTTLLRAHYGQALDLGVAIETLRQDRIAAVTASAIELKSGVLMGLAFKMGAIVLEAPLELVAKFDRAGRDLGSCLQMFDDLGNLLSAADPAKRLEDVKLKRPSFIVGVAADHLTQAQFANLLEVLGANEFDPESVYEFLVAHRIPEVARVKAEAELRRVFETTQSALALTPEERRPLEEVCQTLRVAYEPT